MTAHSHKTRWTREQIRAARQAPLLPLLQQRGLHLVELEAGNAIDFFVQVLGLSFNDAMRQITKT